MSFRHNEDAVVAMWAEARRKMEGVAEEKAVEFETKRRKATPFRHDRIRAPSATRKPKYGAAYKPKICAKAYIRHAKLRRQRNDIDIKFRRGDLGGVGR